MGSLEIAFAENVGNRFEAGPGRRIELEVPQADPVSPEQPPQEAPGGRLLKEGGGLSDSRKAGGFHPLAEVEMVLVRVVSRLGSDLLSPFKGGLLHSLA